MNAIYGGFLGIFVGLAGMSGAGAAGAKFADPVAMEGAGERVAVESPGYASPCWADVTGDGRMDLLVGQFSGGKIKVYAGQEDGSLGKGRWLQADGEVAKVPGVW